MKDIAASYRKHFELKNRFNGDKFWDDDSQNAEVRNLCMKCHGDRLPEDFKYKMIVDCLDLIVEYGEDAGEYIYDIIPDGTWELTSWLSSSNDRYEYCNDAISEKLPDMDDILSMIRSGYHLELQEVFSCIYETLSMIKENEIRYEV